jgi:small subunit ribosomal protein S16
LVRLRLQRHGRKKRPYYHLVAADIRARRDGRIIEDLGRYNPVTAPTMVTLNTERVIYWLQNGAQPTDTVRSILKKEGIFYRLHLMGWGKSAEEIETTLVDWKADKTATKGVEKSRAEVRRAALKAEETMVKKAKAKAAEEAAEEAAKAPVVVEAEAAPADEAPAAEAPAAEADVVEAEAAPADEAPAADDVTTPEA